MQLILIGPTPAIAITTGMARDKAAFLQGRHVPEQRCTTHLAFVRQPLGARIALAYLFVVEVRQLDQDNLGGWLQTFDIRSPDQCHATHYVTHLARNGRHEYVAIEEDFSNWPLR